MCNTRVALTVRFVVSAWLQCGSPYNSWQKVMAGVPPAFDDCKTARPPTAAASTDAGGDSPLTVLNFTQHDHNCTAILQSFVFDDLQDDVKTLAKTAPSY